MDERPRGSLLGVRAGQVGDPSSREIARAASRTASRANASIGQFAEGTTTPRAAVPAIKTLARSLDLTQCVTLAEKALTLRSAHDVRQRVSAELGLQG